MPFLNATKFAAPLAIAAMLTLGANNPAHAQDATSIRVDLTGLQLYSVSGRAEAERRIARAADHIVGEPDPRDLQAISDFEEQRDQIIRSANAQLGCVTAQLALRDRAGRPVADAG